ncbi:MAG: MFS transporter, partial [Deltaproteobacteria bacterium]
MLVLTQLGAGLVTAVLAALVITDRADLTSVLVLTALGAVTVAFDSPTRAAMIAGIVGERDLMSAGGLNSVSIQAGLIVGPLAGGLLTYPDGLEQGGG